MTGDYVARPVSLRSDSLEVKTRLTKVKYEALNLTKICKSIHRLEDACV